MKIKNFLFALIGSAVLLACAKPPVVPSLDPDVPKVKDDIFIMGTTESGIGYGVDVNSIEPTKDGKEVTALVVYIMPPGIKQDGRDVFAASGRVNFNCEAKTYYRKNNILIDSNNQIIKREDFNDDKWVDLGTDPTAILLVAEKLCPDLTPPLQEPPTQNEPAPPQPKDDEEHHKGNPFDGYQYDI